MISRLLLWVVLVCAAIGPVFAQQAIDLSGSHPFKIGKSISPIEGTIDDSSWDRTEVPAITTWEELGGAFGEDIRVHRIRFQIPPDAEFSNPALYIGMVRGADQVFLNGVEIGQTALVGDDRITWKVTTAYAWPRIYAIPPNLLNRDGPNLLAIRIARWSFSDAGALKGPLQIVEHGSAVAASQPRLLRLVSIHTAYLIIDIAAILAVLAAIVFNGSNPVLRWLALALGFYSLLIPVSWLPRYAGLTFDPWVQVYLIKTAALAFIPLVNFVAAALALPIGRLVRIAQLVMILLFLTPPLEQASWHAHVHTMVGYLWLASVFILLFNLTWWAIIGIRAGKTTAWPLVIGLGVMALSNAASLIEPRFDQMSAAWSGDTFFGLSIRVFLLCVCGMAVLRHFELQRDLGSARESALNAHELERRRIARDIHDGVGQWLSTIKLNLLMIGRQHGQAEQDVREAVEHVDVAISDARRIAHDLSPHLIEREGLATALRSHADILSGREGITIRVETDDMPDLPLPEQGHLYRIFQEALQNAIRHGSAKNVDVELRADQRQGKLRIQDDGSGFDPGRDGDTFGIGMSAIRERATLLGGKCQVDSAPGQGTKLLVTFPLDRQA